MIGKQFFKCSRHDFHHSGVDVKNKATPPMINNRHRRHIDLPVLCLSHHCAMHDRLAGILHSAARGRGGNGWCKDYADSSPWHSLFPLLSKAGDLLKSEESHISSVSPAFHSRAKKLSYTEGKLPVKPQHIKKTLKSWCQQNPSGNRGVQQERLFRIAASRATACKFTELINGQEPCRRLGYISLAEISQS